MKTWLKGGLIYSGIGLIFSILHIIMGTVPLFEILIFLMGLPLFFILPTYIPFIIYIGLILNTFLIGSLIGIIIDKIKKKIK